MRTILTPNSDGEEPGDFEAAQVLPEIFISNRAYTNDERVALFCDQMIRNCSAEDAGEAISSYITEQLAHKRSLIAVWKPHPNVLFVNCDIGDMSLPGVLVNVNFIPCEGKTPPLLVSVSVAEPFSCNTATLSREFFEEVLREHDYSVPILDVYPIKGLGTDVDNIAESLEHVRFFYDFLWRDWDDEEECDEYAGLIEKRIQLYYDIQDGIIPGPIIERYYKTLVAYQSKRLELTMFQTNIRGEALPSEAVECWKKYYEMLMLCGILKFWEDLRLRSHGPFCPRIYKRRKGRRTSGKTVTHIVAQMMTKDMIKSFSEDVLMRQHDNLSAALDSCYSGDTVVVFPGDYHTAALASLTDDITIKGEGVRKDVQIHSAPSYDHFVASKASQLMLMNLTLVQHGTCGGIVVVESGQTTLENCLLKCEGTGVCVLTGASLVMKNCEISGAQGAGVELCPGSYAELHHNEIHHCSNQLAKDTKGSQGGINLKVLPLPQLKLSNNYIHDNNGYGLTILVPDNLYKASNEDLEKKANGNKNETDHLSKALQELSLEITTNRLESNTKGAIGLQHKM
ncbi:testicular spindle-associated protein SHCBP1L isoform X1 [Esox lucius]|nr:testicular spindle-associated protein SHCBP1L isoform X1 [Esox lucius]